MATTPHAQAQKAKELNEKNIEQFIEKTSEIAAGKSLENIEKVQAFLNRHLHEDARFKSIMQFDIPGFPTQETSLTLNKSDFINNIGQGAHTMSDYENTVRIRSIKISSDKRKATVQTIGEESGMMDMVAGTDDIQQVPVEGTSSCQQIITLSQKGYIQMYQANCETRIRFKDEF